MEGSYVTDLLSLNADVLHCIFSYLHCKDALSISLTARRAHDLAIHRVAAVAICRDRHQVSPLHRYMLGGPGSSPRAQYLESLIVWDCAYNTSDQPQLVTNLNPVAHDWANIRLIIDVLAHASNLREVVLPFLYPSIEHDSRLGDVLHALQHLTKATFDTVDETTMEAMHRLSRRLEYLELQFLVKDEQLLFPFRPGSNFITYPSLLRNLAAFTSLRTLRLSFLRMKHSSPSIADISRGPTPPYCLSSICTLELWRVGPSALDIVQLCPRLTSLCYSLLSSSLSHDEDPDETDSPATGAQWPSLRRLRVDTLKDAAHARHILGHVDHLYISSNIDISSVASNEANMLLAVVERTAPVGMRFSLAFDSRTSRDDEAQLWADLAACAPKLRVLEVMLVFGGAYALDAFSGWLHTLPDILSPLGPALRSLRLTVRRQRRRHVSLRRSLSRWDSLDKMAALQRIPLDCELVAAFPALNCLELWEAGRRRIKHGPRRVGVDDVADTDSIFGLRLDLDYPESVFEPWDDCHGTVARYQALFRRWWRVRRSSEDVGGGPALEGIDRMEAMHMHTYLRDADDEGVARFEDVFP
ncbi:hypothetical protein C2E23DRAFT_787826 [Lenzites betulinus]|nr:hypothetical protein C2E23DRAFT_787826 [Lenzites betulinus]